jgi:hypothetical protein
MSADVSELQCGTSGDGIKKLISAAEWIVDYSHTCPGCKNMYKNRNPPEEPPCDTCRVIPDQENRAAIKVFFMEQDQYIMCEGGPVAHNHMAFYEGMKLCGVKAKDRLKCYGKLRALSAWWLERQRDKRDD